MAAPSGTKWGSIVGGYGRIGIYVSVSNISNTQSKRHTEVWFWSKYSVRDSSNTFYYNDNSTSATTSMGSRNISTSVDSGSGWSTSNQQKISEADYTFDRWSSSRSYNVAAKLSGIDRVGGTMYCTTSYTIPAKPSYTVTFVNGYGGTIKSQTVYYGESASAPANPTRTGYSFAGWSGSYTNVTSSRTITATWSIWKYLISYDANGGSGAPGSQSKDYGSSIILSSTRPTRANYNFLGWAASASGDVAYSPGSTYSENASIKLYAVWQLAYQKPRISGFTATRCDSAGVIKEDGTYVKVSFKWSTDKAVSKIGTQYYGGGASSWTEYKVIEGSGTSGSVSEKVLGGNWSTDASYFIRAYVSDSSGTTYSVEIAIPTMQYPIDVKAGGKGVAFGKVAESNNLLDIGWIAQFRRGFKGGFYGEIVPNNNLDTCYKSGVYYYSTNTVGRPDNYGHVLVTVSSGDTHNGNDNWINQTAFSTTSTNIYVRSKVNNGGWTSWKRLATTSDLSWGNISGKPSTFPPSSHSHTFGQISGNIVYFGSSMLEQDGNNVFLLNKSNGSLHFRTNNTYTCDFYLQPGSGAYYGFLLPNVSNKITIGSTSYRWYGGYFGQACNTSSDVRLKDNIIPLDSELSMFLSGGNTNIFEKFFFKLIPKAYSLKMENSTEHEGRMHIGMIAQDVEKALNDCGLTDKNVAFLSHSYWVDEETGEEKDEYSLRYEEFIALNTHMIQKAHRKIEAQQKEIDDLKSQVQELKGLVLKLSNIQ